MGILGQEMFLNLPKDMQLITSSSVQSLSCVQLLATPMDCSTSGFPVHHQLPELAQIHVHPVSDAIQPSHPLPSPSPSAFNLPASKIHQSFPMSWFFESDGQSIGASASALPMNIQGWFPLGLTGLISFLSKGISRVFSSTIVWKHQLFGSQLSLWSNSHICTWLFQGAGIF